MALSMLLRMAVLTGVQEAVDLRIRAGDDVNASDAKGHTPDAGSIERAPSEPCSRWRTWCAPSRRCWRLTALGRQKTEGTSSPEDINLRFKALAQTQIVRAHLKPTSRLLEEVQPPANLDHPSVIDTNLPIVHVRIELYLQLDI